MKNSAEDGKHFGQQLAMGARLSSPLHIAFAMAFAILMLAFIAGFIYTLAERGEVPDIMLNHLSEADSMAQWGDYEGATAAYRRASMLAPDDLEALLRLHGVAALNRDEEDIWWALERALQIDPQDARVQMLSGDAYLEADDFEQAGLHYARVIQILPDAAGASYKLGYIAMQLNNPTAARSWFEYTLAIEPTHPGARQYMISLGANTPQ